MSRKIALVALLSVTALGWAAVSARQTQRVPGPGSGVTTVTGTVQLGNSPPATPSGEWKVAVANTPQVNVANRPTVISAPLEFLKTGTRYAITWTDGAREVVTVTGVQPSAWVRVTDGGPGRWLNLGSARSVEETRD